MSFLEYDLGLQKTQEQAPRPARRGGQPCSFQGCQQPGHLQHCLEFSVGYYLETSFLSWSLLVLCSTSAVWWPSLGMNLGETALDTHLLGGWASQVLFPQQAPHAPSFLQLLQREDPLQGALLVCPLTLRGSTMPLTVSLFSSQLSPEFQRTLTIFFSKNLLLFWEQYHFPTSYPSKFKHRS